MRLLFLPAAAALTSSLGYDLSYKGDASALPSLSRDVLEKGATEPAGRGETACGLSFEQLRPIFREKRPAVFVSAAGGLPVFASDAALDLTSGWPAFSRPIADDHVVLVPDGETAFEVRCARTGLHLGHRISEEYYCINCAALVVVQPRDAPPPGCLPAAPTSAPPPPPGLARVLGDAWPGA